MNYVDLFSGAGGLSLGFEMAGFNNVFSVEYDKKIAESYKKNFPTHNLLVKDIQEITDDEIITLQHNQEVDVVIGGPPCQGFSLAGRIGRSFVEDKRNYLFKEFVRVVKIIDPPMFVMENVARILSHNKGETIKELTNEFKKIGYNVQYKVLQAADYGVPQKRQRIFIVGTKNKEFNFPTPIGTTITVKEAIGDLPPLKSGERSEVPNHFSMNHSSQMLKKMSYIGDGGNRNQIPEDLRPKTGDIRKYIRYDSQKPSVTVTGDMRKIFHYEQNRALTAREGARIQSFPDNYKFVGGLQAINTQIGNAVPPILSIHLANRIKKFFEDNNL